MISQAANYYPNLRFQIADLEKSKSRSHLGSGTLMKLLNIPIFNTDAKGKGNYLSAAVLQSSMACTASTSTCQHPSEQITHKSTSLASKETSERCDYPLRMENQSFAFLWQ